MTSSTAFVDDPLRSPSYEDRRLLIATFSSARISRGKRSLTASHKVGRLVADDKLLPEKALEPLSWRIGIQSELWAFELGKRLTMPHYSPGARRPGRLVQLSESEGPISFSQPIRAILCNGVQADGVETFAGLYWSHGLHSRQDRRHASMHLLRSRIDCREDDDAR